jgi:diguanylate cyclase (GGDEF)-like protein
MFEIQTFAFTLLPLLFASLTVLLVNWRIHRKMRGTAEWAVAAACRFVGISLIATGEPLPIFLSQLAGYFLVVTGDLFAVRGLSLFAGLPPFRRVSWATLLLALTALIYFTYVLPNPFARVMVLVVGHVISILLLVIVQVKLYRQEGLGGSLVLALSSFWEIFLAPGLLVIMQMAGRNVDVEVALGWVQPMSAIAMIGILQTFGLTLLAANRTQRELRDMALLDTLTGVPNRRAFDGAVRRAVESTRRNGTRLGLVLIDIDFFKKVNDTYGHGVGDQLLRHVATTVSGTLRDSDFFARIGGEEFAILVDGTTPEALTELAERSRLAVERQPLLRPGEPPLSCTLSSGLALSEPGRVEFTQLYAVADAALYRAKGYGRNRVEMG